LESKIRDLLSGGVNLPAVVSMEFLIQGPLNLVDIGDILPGVGSDQSIFELPVRSLNLASGLRRGGVNDLNIAVLENLFPLRAGLIGQKVMFSPD